MKKEQFVIFKNKQNELYDKYANSKDPKAYDDMNKEWLEFIKNFGK